MRIVAETYVDALSRSQGNAGFDMVTEPVHTGIVYLDAIHLVMGGLAPQLGTSIKVTVEWNDEHSTD